MKRGLFSVVLGLFFVIGLGMGMARAEIGVTDTEIKVGYFGALTGPAAIIGQAQVHGMKVCMDDINAQGGIHGRKLKQLYEDDNFLPSRAVEMVKKLVSKEEVFCFLGPLGTAGLLAAYPFIETNKVPVLFYAAGGSEGTRPVKKYIFGYCAPYAITAAIQVDWAVKKLGKKNLAFINMWGPAGEDNARVAEERVKLYPGVKIVMNEKLKNVKMDYSGLVSKMKADGVDCVIPTTTAQWTIPLLKEMERQAWKPAIILGQATGDLTQHKDIVGTAAEGAYFTNYTLPITTDVPYMAKYRECMQKYGDPKYFNYYSMLSYAITRMLEDALKQCGKDLTREKIIQTLESWINYDTGFFGKVTYGPTDHEGQSSLVICVMKGGQAEVIVPAYYPDPAP